MPMKVHPTAKDYLNSLDPMQLKKVCSLKDTPDFYLFLAEACKDMVKNASFAAACQDVGVPTEYTKSPESLHYLAVAITNQLNGNA